MIRAVVNVFDCESETRDLADLAGEGAAARSADGAGSSAHLVGAAACATAVRADGTGSGGHLVGAAACATAVISADGTGSGGRAAGTCVRAAACAF